MKSVLLFPAALRAMLLVAVLSLAGRVQGQCTANAGPATHTMCAGTPYNLNGSGTGQAPLSYSWTGSPFITNPNAQQATFNFPVPVLADLVVNITLTVTDANGCVAQDVIAITVQATPEASLSIDPNDPLVVTTTFDGQTAFTLCGQGLPSYAFPFVDNSTPGASSYNVAWGAPPPNSSFGAAGWTQSHTYNTGLSTVTYTVTNGNLCANTESYFVFIGSNPSGGLINPGGTINVCTGEQLCIPIQGTAGNTPGTEYYVSFGDGTDTTFYQPAPAQICHAWALSSCDQPPYFTMHFDAVNPCSAFPTFSDVGPIVVSTTPVADFNILPGDTVCQGTPITFQNTSDAAEAPNCNAAKVAWVVTPSSGYSTSSNLGGINGNTVSTVGWAPNATQNPVITFNQSGTYCIKLYTGNNSCGVDSITKCICVEAPPHAHFSLAPPGTCVPQVLNPVNTSSNPNSCRTTYQWFTDFTSSICNSTNGAAMTGANTNTPQITISQAGGYNIRLRATNSCGFVDSTMTINLAAAPQLALYPVGPICEGDFVQPVVQPQACGTPLGTFTWSFPGGTPVSSTGQNAPNVQYQTFGNYTVSVSASSACGPGNANAPLIVNDTPPSAQAAAVDSTLCQGQTLNLLANTITNATYQWSGPGFSTGLEDPSITNMPQGQFTYTVTPYLGICDGPPSSVTIDVAPADQITIPTPAAICVGDSAHLTASGSSNYSWTTSNGTPVGTGASIWVHPAATTTYIVNSGTNGNGCPGTQSVQVVVNQPTNVVTDANITVCDQAVAVQLNMSPSGGTWSDADLVNLNAATGVITPIPNSLGTDTLYYTFVNANNCTSTAQTIVTINNEVAAVAGPDVLKCEGDPVFNLGGAPAGGTWTGNITSFNPSTAGVFNLTYTYGSGSCQTSDALVITVLDTPNVVVNSFALCANAQPIQLPNGTPGGGTWSGNVNGGGPWTFDPASGTSILTYTVSLNGCTGSDTALAIVTPPPVADPGIDTVLCDQSIAFVLVGNYGNAGTWTSSSPYFTNNPPQFTPVPGALGTWYATYTYTDAGGCTDADSVAITVGTTPLADAGLDNHVCENGGTVNYTGAPIGSWQSTTYMSSAGVFDPAVAGSGPHDIIYCTGVGTCANCDTAVVIVDAPPNVTATSPLSYCDYEPPVDLVENPQGGTWSGSAGLTDVNQGLFDPGLAALNANNLIYVYTDPNTNCRDTAFVTITINVEPVASFTNAAVACQYDGTFTFTADNTAGNITSWQWNFGDGSPSATGQVVQHAYQTVDTVTVTLVVGTGNCTDTTTSTVMVWPAPVASLSLDTTSGCGPLTVQFTNNSTGPQLSYAWTINNTLVSNNATFGPYDFTAGVLADTTYAIELDVSNQCGNASALDTVVVFSSPTAYFGPDFNGGCSPFPVHFINASVGQADSYTWDWGDGSATSSDTSIIVAHTFYTGANDTTYTVTLTATNQCGTDTHTYDILVHPNTITAFFNTDTTFGCAPLQVCFTQYSVGVTNWHWDFGFQNNLSNAQSPCFTYTQAGTFTATLFGDNGCSYDTVSVQITVLPSPPVTFTFAPDPVCGNVPVQFTNTTPDLAWCHWEFGDGDTSALTNPVHVYDIGNSYQVQLEAGWTQNTCTSDASATVTVYTVPQAVPGPVDSVFCAPHVMSATNGSIGQNLAYQWSLNNTIIGAGQLPPPQNIVDAGTYVLQLIVTDQISGCRDTTSTTWVANPSPTSDFTLTPVDPCGRPALLDATSNSTSGSFLEWWLDDAFISVQNPLNHALIGEGVHELELVATLAPGGCTDTARTTFELYALPTAAFSTDTACTGHFIPLHDASIAADQEWWYYNGVYVSTDPFTHAMVPETVGLDTIALTVMSDHGCTDSTFRIVRVYPTSPSTFTPELIGDCQTVLLAPDTVMAHTGYHWTINYNWDSPDVAPTYYYDANSVANIPMMLIATTEDGCRDTTMSFFPIPDCVYVPNAFSPDGDGLNEGFVPSILPPEHFQYLQIFNRWGEMIADINSTRNPRWDGTYGGEPVEVGVYVWRLKLTSRVEPYIGHVTVLR